MFGEWQFDLDKYKLNNIITTMKTYNQIKADHQKEMSLFEGIFFAFSNDQFKEGVKKVGASKDNPIVKIGAGGFILKNKVKAFKDMLARHEAERKQIRKDRKVLLEALVYELRNHEYGYTYDIEPALEALDLKIEDVPANILKKAKKEANIDLND
jgi:hypothetical protein